MVLLKKEIKADRWKLIISFILLFILAIAINWQFPYVKGLLEKGILEGMPRWMVEGAEDQRNFSVYIAANWYDKNLIQISVLLSILLGMSVFAREVENHTIEFLLSRPLSRKRLFLEKTLYHLLMILFIITINTAILGITATVMNYSINFSRLFIGITPVFGKCFIVYSTALLLSLFFDDQVQSGIFTLVGVLIVWSTSFIEVLDFINIFSYAGVTPYYIQGIFSIMDLVIIYFIGLLIYGISYYRFKIRDF